MDEDTGKMAMMVMQAVSDRDGDSYGVNLNMALEAMGSIVGMLLAPLPDDDREDLFAQFIVDLRSEMDRAIEMREVYPDDAPEMVSVQ